MDPTSGGPETAVILPSTGCGCQRPSNSRVTRERAMDASLRKRDGPTAGSLQDLESDGVGKGLRSEKGEKEVNVNA